MDLYKIAMLEVARLKAQFLLENNTQIRLISESPLNLYRKDDKYYIGFSPQEAEKELGTPLWPVPFFPHKQVLTMMAKKKVTGKLQEFDPEMTSADLEYFRTH